MALFKSKQKEFSIEDLNSPVIKKVMEFNTKKGHLGADLAKNQDKVQALTLKLEEVRKQYFDTFNEDFLKEIPAIESELSALQNVIKAQKDILTKGDKREYILSPDEQESLKEAFQPIRQKRDEITKRLTAQLAEVEKTLDELAEEQKGVHEAWGKVWGHVYSASNENWMIGNDLNRQREASVAQYKLGQLQGHNALDIHNWHR